ncbi:MAG: TSUP family transporter [Lautropia sp.]
MTGELTLLLSGETLAWVLLAALASAIIGGIGGFGTGIILTAVLVPLIGVKAVVPVLSLAGVLINGGRFWFYRRQVDWRAVRYVLVGALPCLLAGTWIYAQLDARPLGLVIAALILASVPLRRWLKARRVEIGPRGLLIGGAVFGAANGFASGMGVIVVSLLLGTGLGGAAVLATDALIAIVVDIARALLFGRYQLLDAGSAALGIAIGLATLPGSWLASLLVQRLHARLHLWMMETLIIAGAAMILWNSLRVPG